MTDEFTVEPASEGVNSPGPLLLRDPCCQGMQEIPTASEQRTRVAKYLEIYPKESEGGDATLDPDLAQMGTVSAAPSLCDNGLDVTVDPKSPLFHHLSHGLALTVGSALGSTPPSIPASLDAFLVPNKALLTAGARAWSKHAHRSLPPPSADPEEKRSRQKSDGWWGTPSGPVSTINERALALFWKIVNAATWRNLHWLPHRVLVYEVRVKEGYGMRWSQDRLEVDVGGDAVPIEKPWIFRGFVEPMMENGHEVGWKHVPS